MVTVQEVVQEIVQITVVVGGDEEMECFRSGGGGATIISARFNCLPTAPSWDGKSLRMLAFRLVKKTEDEWSNWLMFPQLSDRKLKR